MDGSDLASYYSSVPQGVPERVETARELARRAGRVLLEWAGRLPAIETKQQSFDLVTCADRESEALLVAGLIEAFPDDGIIGEEGTNRESKNGYKWVLDPLDGTTNFVHQLPFYMVSVGLLLDGARVGGICYGPAMGEEYFAVRGQGSYLNGQVIQVSKTTRLEEALLATGFPYNRREILDELLGPIGRSLAEARGMRRCGSAAYDLCMLAKGSLDGYFERDLHPWDTAAGALIVSEAGGRLTHFDGAPYNEFRGHGAMSSETPTIVASNAHIHERLLEVIVGAE
jgi:myo-inositol-1(or 4)-monophosphatase